MDLTSSFDTIFFALSLTYGITVFLCVLYSNFYCAVSLLPKGEKNSEVNPK